MSKLSSPRENIPNLDNLYNIVCDYVTKHQGEKGYIDTNFNKNLDVIYSFVYDTCDSDVATEQIVYAVRVVNKELQILPRPYMRTYNNEPSKEELEDNENWESVKYGECYYVQTLFNIAENIEEYCITDKK